jgi:O-antigen/teichoic acid export membrane protein
MKPPAILYRFPGLGSLMANVSGAAAIFLIFRTAYLNLGPSAVGIWALIQSIMLISRLADSGSGGNITRLVAIERDKFGGLKLRKFILTGFLVGTGPILLLSLPMVAPTFLYIQHNYTHAMAAGPMFLLVLCSVGFGTLNSASAILAGCLDGLGLMALRGCLVTVANAVFLVAGYVLIHTMGNVGLGLAYVAYAAAQLILLASSLLFFRHNPVESYPEPAIKELVRRTFRFNSQFLFVSLCQLLLDPICKILIGRFGSLDSVAIFDIANKVTAQARILYQAVLQSVLPLVSREGRAIEPALHAKLAHWNRRVARWSLYTMSLIVFGSALLSHASLGRFDTHFVLIVLILATGNAINTVGLVGYYAELGSGRLTRLVAVYVLIAIANLSLGALFGYFWGAAGVALSYAIALAGSGILFTQAIFTKIEAMAKALVRPVVPELTLYLFACGVVAAFAFGTQRPSIATSIAIVIGGTIACVLLFALRERDLILSRSRSLAVSGMSWWTKR